MTCQQPDRLECHGIRRIDHGIQKYGPVSSKYLCQPHGRQSMLVILGQQYTQIRRETLREPQVALASHKARLAKGELGLRVLSLRCL